MSFCTDILHLHSNPLHQQSLPETAKKAKWHMVNHLHKVNNQLVSQSISFLDDQLTIKNELCKHWVKQIHLAFVCITITKKKKCVQFLSLFASKVKAIDRKCYIVIYENYTELFSLLSTVRTQLDVLAKKSSLSPFRSKQSCKI